MGSLGGVIPQCRSEVLSIVRRILCIRWKQDDAGSDPACVAAFITSNRRDQWAETVVNARLVALRTFFDLLYLGVTAVLVVSMQMQRSRLSPRSLKRKSPARPAGAKYGEKDVLPMLVAGCSNKEIPVPPWN